MKKLLFAIAISGMLVACNSATKKAEQARLDSIKKDSIERVKADSIAAIEKQKQDSITAVVEKQRQDSIAAAEAKKGKGKKKK
jgi:uncharacterized protein YcfL